MQQNTGEVVGIRDVWTKYMQLNTGEVVGIRDVWTKYMQQNTGEVVGRSIVMFASFRVYMDFLEWHKIDFHPQDT